MLGLSNTNEDWVRIKGFLGRFLHFYFEKKEDQLVGRKKLRLVIRIAYLRKKMAASAKKGQET